MVAKDEVSREIATAKAVICVVLAGSESKEDHLVVKLRLWFCQTSKNGL